MIYGAPTVEATARRGDPSPDDARGRAVAALAAVLAVSPAAQALFGDDGRCAAASSAFSLRAAAAADAAGRLSAAFVDAADVKDVTLAGRLYRLVTLPDGPAPPAGKANVPAPRPVLRALLDAIPAAISAKDRDLRFLFMNKYQAELWGVDAAAAIGRTALEVKGHQSMASADFERRVLDTGEPVPFFDENHAGADGVARDWLARSMPLKHPESGETTGVVTFALDITDRKRLEAAALATKKTAEGANQATTLFLAQVSHELRTPINAIIGFTEMMTQEIFGPLGAPQYHGYAGDVLKAARHLLGIITDVLDVTRLDAGALSLDLEPVHPGAVIAEAARMAAPAAARKRVVLRQLVEKALPALNADPRRLRQALINLIANAVKFTPDGGRVVFGAHRTDAGVELYVEDSGIGMTAEEIEVALLVFGRVRAGYAIGQEGTGIGLPLAKALIERHGARFAIESVPGQGTKIRTLFPPQCLITDGGA